MSMNLEHQKQKAIENDGLSPVFTPVTMLSEEELMIKNTGK